ncbi:MAG: glycosyl hydrolase family 18 protein [Ignavibacteriales bacterium]
MLVTLLITLFITIPNQNVDINYENENNYVTALYIKADLVNCKNTPPVIENNNVLIPVDIVKKYFDPNLLWDQKTYRVITTSKDKVLKIKLNSKTALLNNKPIKSSVPLKKIKGTMYLPLGLLKEVYGLNVNFNEKNDSILIDNNQQNYKQGKAAQIISFLREKRDNSSQILKILVLNDKVEIINKYKDMYKVMTEDGFVGFIQAQSIQEETADFMQLKDNPNSLVIDDNKKISMAWDQMLNIGSIDQTDGLQILAPTWFYVSDKDGTVKSKADDESIRMYVKKAHEADKKVWAMLTNSFSPVISSSILNDSLLRDKVISQVTAYAETYDLDGINIDFENMSQEETDMFTQFVRELAPILREQGKVVSIDIAAPTSGWRCYDAKALSDAADYINLMTYDQHWSNCPYSGSVAQYTWVEDKLKKTLAEVPSEKLLLGIPFYTRGWKEELDSNGLTKVTQYKVFSMSGARSEVKVNNADIEWDDESGQLYAQYTKNNAIYKIWLENDASVNLKSSLVHKYNLAGVAIWEKSFADENVWKVLKRNLYQNKSYADWIKYNKKMYKRMKSTLYCKS